MSDNNQQMPGAWYDLAGRVSILQSVASCALEAVPHDVDNQARCNHAANLIGAMQDILKLIEQDVKQIEATLKL
ncbi:MAG: hypothetical protein PHI29_09115 [Gallionella sp.]|nr:hypothetical protein [Gallionella sp.]